MPAGRGSSFADGGLLKAFFKHFASEKCLRSTVLKVKTVSNFRTHMITNNILINVRFRNNVNKLVYILALNM